MTGKDEWLRAWGATWVWTVETALFPVHKGGFCLSQAWGVFFSGNEWFHLLAQRSDCSDKALFGVSGSVALGIPPTRRASRRSL